MKLLDYSVVAFGVVSGYFTLCNGAESTGSSLSWLFSLKGESGAHQRTEPTVSPSDFDYSMFFGGHMYEVLKQVVAYKPPVGLVSLILGIRMVQSGKAFAFLQEEEVSANDNGGCYYPFFWGRSPTIEEIDVDDSRWKRLGIGIDRVRCILCATALGDEVKSWVDGSSSGRKIQTLLVKGISSLSQSSILKDRSRVQLLHEVLIPGLAAVQGLQSIAHEQIPPSLEEEGLPPTQVENLVRILDIAVTLLEVQVLDSLLRLARDRLIQTSHRLRASIKQWDHKIQHKQPPASSEYLVLVEAAYKAELYRLGTICKVLCDRPIDMTSSQLLRVRKESFQVLSKFQAKASSAMDQPGRLLRTLRSPRTAGSCSRDALLKDDEGMWREQARHWSYQARSALTQIVRETLHGSRDPGYRFYRNQTTSQTLSEFQPLEASLLNRSYSSKFNELVPFVDSLAGWRRIGESRASTAQTLGHAFYRILHMLQGIPTYLLCVVMAHWLHNHCYTRLNDEPQIRAAVQATYQTALGIANVRVWEPIKGIIDDLLNRHEGIMAEFSLADEEHVLDSMLKQLGFGDGSQAMRLQALKKAALKYEQHVHGTHLYWNVANGQVVRLLLLQLQQLKVGLLSAMDIIDTVIIKGNRIHLQIIAAVPALWIIVVLARFIFRYMHNVRVMDLRPVREIHKEMGHCLDQIRGAILMQQQSIGDKTNGRRLPAAETIGTVVVHLHRYCWLLQQESFFFSESDLLRSSLQSLARDIILAKTAPDNSQLLLQLEAVKSIQRQHEQLLTP